MGSRCPPCLPRSISTRAARPAAAPSLRPSATCCSTTRLQVQAYKPHATFRQFWAPVAGVLAGADLTYGNLESPIAEGVKPGGVATKDPGRTLDRVVYGRKSDALIFNTHPSVAADLKASGFGVVSTANNHAADRGAARHRPHPRCTRAGRVSPPPARGARPTPQRALVHAHVGQRPHHRLARLHVRPQRHARPSQPGSAMLS